MHYLRPVIYTISIFSAAVTFAQDVNKDFDVNVRQLLERHYQQYKDMEYFSGATLSILIPDEKIRNYYIGNVTRDSKSKKISPDTLFQIGSITKSFTAAIFLQLEKDKKLSLDDTLKNWLPKYDKWSAVTLKSLLDMTSGLPNYSDTPVWNYKQYMNQSYLWTDKELIEFAYPRKNFSPPLKSGYFYTNTSYILASMIVEKITENTFQDELINRIIKPADLKNTFYMIPKVDDKILGRMAQGYNYNQYDNPSLVGEEISNNLTWAAAAGGVIANSEDIIKWVKALFVDNKILDDSQKQKMQQLVSSSSGKSIEKTSNDDPQGFGLGIAQGFNKEMGTYWFYEGETLGFRALYFYLPCNGVIVSSIFNSATNTENDHAKDLMIGTYKLILKQYPRLVCK